MKRKILITLLLIAVIGSGAYYYVNKFVLPAELKRIIVEKIFETTGRHATMTSVDFFLFKGFIINGLTIFEKDLEQPPLAVIPQFSFRILYFPILQERKIVIPAITVLDPTIAITRYPGNTWNFSDIIDLQKAQKPAKSPFSLFVGGLTIQNATLKFVDKALPSEFSETIEDLNLRVGIALPKNIRFSLEATVLNPSYGNPSPMAIVGQYDPARRKLISQVTLQNIPIAKYANTYGRNSNILVNSGTLTTAAITINFQDGTINAKGKLETADLEATIAPDKKLKGQPALEFSAQYAPQTNSLAFYSGTLTPNVVSLTNLPYIGEARNINGKISFDQNKASSEALEVTAFDQKVQISGTLTDFQNPKADVRASSSSIDLSKLVGIFKPWLGDKKIDLAGTSDAVIQWKGPLNPPFESQITASADLNGVTLRAPQLPAPLTGINGRIKYASDTISLENIKSTFANSVILVSGTIKQLKDPILDVRIVTSGFDIEKLNQIFPALLQKTGLKSATGLADIDLALKGPADSLAHGKIAATLTFKDASAVFRRLPDAVTQINGKINYSPDGASLDNLRCIFQNNSYVLNGKLSNFKEPAIDLTAKSQDLDFVAKIKASKDTYRITSCKGQYRNFPFDLKGTVIMDSDGEPQADLQTQIEFDLKNLTSLFPHLKEKLAAVNPAGLCTLQGTIHGPLKQWRQWQTTAGVTSPQIILYGLKFKGAALKFSQENLEINQCDLTADLYDGPLRISLSSDLADDKLPFILTGNLEKVNLAELKNDTPAAKQDISGLFSASLTTQGSLKDFQSMTGEGSILVKEGRLWELKLLKGLGQFLFIPEFDDIVFREAMGDFTIKQKKISTSNLEFYSPQAMLGCAGWIDFAGNIDMEIVAEFSEETIADSASLKKMITTILTQGDAYLTIRIGGTLKEPKYALSPTGVLRKTKNFIMEGLKSIFEQ